MDYLDLHIGDDDTSKSKDIASKDVTKTDDEFHHDSKMSFDADRDYSSKYHFDAYNPETYHYYRLISESIQLFLNTFVNKNPSYDQLRTIDINKLRVGDRVKCVCDVDGNTYDNSLLLTIVEINENAGEKTFTLDFKNKPIIVSVQQIRVSDEPILRLKNLDMSKLYLDFKEGTNTESHVDFFYCFTEYFKINEKILYDALPRKTRNEILEELNNRTGCLSKMNVFVW